MTFKRSIWLPIAAGLSLLNLVSVPFTTQPWWHATSHAVLALAFGLWAQRLRGNPAGCDIGRMRQQLEAQDDALEDARSTLASQSSQLAELQERVDFAERLLIQARDRQALEARTKRE